MRVEGLFKRIAGCQACDLHRCQKPLLDRVQLRADVMWVGLSAKKFEKDIQTVPLAPNTSTGSIIQTVEEDCKSIRFYKTNLVKCPPLNEQGKLR